MLHLGVYGDVLRVKILYNKKDGALVQMAEPHQAHLGESLEYIIILQFFFNVNFFVSPSHHHYYANISHASFGQSSFVRQVHTSDAIQVPDCSAAKRRTARLGTDKRLHLVAVTPIQEAWLQKLPEHISTVVHSPLVQHTVSILKADRTP